MDRKDGTLVLCIAMVLCLCLIPSAMASTEEQQTNLTKDAAQLKMEALEAELGEEGMHNVEEYLKLQASLPDVVKASPYSWIAFAATDKESQVAKLTAIDESGLEKEDKEKLKADLQDIWDRYPDKFVVADNLVLRDVAKILEKRFIASVNLSELGVDRPDDGGAEISRFPDYGTEQFQALLNKPNVIDIRGTMPELVLEEDKKIWLDKVNRFGLETSSAVELKPYMEQNGGPVIMTGYSSDGCLLVSFNIKAKGTFDETKYINNIYEILNNKSTKLGVKDIPVIFEYESIPVEEEIPGFTVFLLIMVILVLYGKAHK